MKKTLFLIAITLLSTGLFAQKNTIKVADNFMLFDHNKNIVFKAKDFQLPKDLSQLNFIKKRNLKAGTYIYIIQKKGEKSMIGYTYKGSVSPKKEPIIISEKQMLSNKITFYELEDGSSKEELINLDKKESVHLKHLSFNPSIKTNLKLFKDGKRIPNNKIKDSVFINSKIGALSFSANNYDKKTIIFIESLNNTAKGVNLKLKGKNITYYIDNKKQPKGYNINDLSPDSIKSISVVRGYKTNELSSDSIKKLSVVRGYKINELSSDSIKSTPVVKGFKKKENAIFITTKEKPIKNPIVYINGKRSDKNVKNITLKKMRVTIVKDEKTAFKLGIPYNENGIIYIETEE